MNAPTLRTVADRHRPKFTADGPRVLETDATTEAATGKHLTRSRFRIARHATLPVGMQRSGKPIAASSEALLRRMRTVLRAAHLRAPQGGAVSLTCGRAVACIFRPDLRSHHQRAAPRVAARHSAVDGRQRRPAPSGHTQSRRGWKAVLLPASIDLCRSCSSASMVSAAPRCFGKPWNIGRAVAYQRAADWPNFSRRCLVAVAEVMIGLIGGLGAILRTMRYCKFIQGWRSSQGPCPQADVRLCKGEPPDSRHRQSRLRMVVSRLYLPWHIARTVPSTASIVTSRTPPSSL